jgi:hypothetical protein
MKNPTAIELWNFLIIIVPPILKVSNINADHIDVNDSLKPRVDITAHDINASTPVNPKIEYLSSSLSSSSNYYYHYYHIYSMI